MVPLQRKGQQATHRLRLQSKSRGGGLKLRREASTHAEDYMQGTMQPAMCCQQRSGRWAHQAARLLRSLAPAHNINGQLQRQNEQGRGARLSSCPVAGLTSTGS